MLFLMLDKEKAGNGAINAMFSREEIQAILGGSQPPEDVGRWRKQLVEQFKDDRGQFLEEPEEEPTVAELSSEKKSAVAELSSELFSTHRKRGRPPVTKKMLKFSSHFEAAAKLYVRGTVTSVEPLSIPHADLESVLEKKGGDIFRKEVDLLGRYYFPAYAKLMDDLTSVASNPPRLARDIKEYAPYWSIVLIAWRQYSQDRGKSLNRAEFEMDVRHALRSVDKSEIYLCFSSLVESNILVPGPKSYDAGYILNQECLPALGRYALALKEAREHLASLLHAEFDIKKS